MKPAPRRWEVADVAPIPGFPPLLGRILAARGLDRATAEIHLDTAPRWHDPIRLPTMPEAVVHLAIALEERRRIAVYGDYDADGVTACALLTRALRAAGADVVPYIPNRMTEGYGLHAPALEELSAMGVRCVVTVDCGTSSPEVVAHRPAGMALLVTDHHLPHGDGIADLPPADAVVNPKRPDSAYPFDALSGSGVAWKLVQALEAERLVPPGTAADAVALAAIGTVADMMPLRGENRALVAAGLRALAEAPPPGLAVLLEIAGIRDAPQASDLAFSVAPRLNAAGRMEDALCALQLCLAQSVEEARPLAERLQAQNLRRQEAVGHALAEAEAQTAELVDDSPAIVVGDPSWPVGIVGLVAGRLAERYARPTFVACLEGPEARGSARSAAGVHLVRLLEAAAPHLLRYGGHAQAAGFSFDPERFADLREALCAAAASQLGDAPPERVLRIDAVVTGADISPATCHELARLEPCGQGNPEPLLALLDAEVLGCSTFGNAGQHLRVLLRDARGGAPVEAIAFDKPGLAAHLPRGRRVDACFVLDLDRWDGMDRLRLRLRDLRPARRTAGGATVPTRPATVTIRS